MRRSLVTTCLLFAATAFAQTAIVQHKDRSQGATLPPTSAAWVDEATAPVINPAGLRFLDSAQLFYLHERSLNRGQLVDGLYLGDQFFNFLGLGLSLEWVRRGPSVPDHRKTMWSLALGSPLLSLGTSLNIFSSNQDPDLDAITCWNLGLSSRPVQLLSFAAVAKNIDKPTHGSVTLERQFDLAIGLRPFGDRYSVGVDYLFNGADGFSKGRGQYTLRAEVWKGVVLGGGLAHGFSSGDGVSFQLSVTLDTPHLGITYAGGGVSEGADHILAVRASTRKYPAITFSQGTVALIDLNEAMGKGVSPALAVLGFTEVDPYLQLSRLLDEMIRDPELKGLVLKIDSPLPETGLGKAEELRRAIVSLRTAGKRVFVLLLGAGDSEYLIASAADKVFAVPQAMLPINGFAANVVFLGEAMDKLSIHWDVARVGAYKNAPDALTRSSMSPEQRESVDAYLDTDVRHFQTAVAAARGVSVERINQVWKEGLLTPQRLRDLGLVDEVIVPADLKSRLSQAMPGASYEPRYRPRQTRDDHWGERRQIAIIPVIGSILSGKSREDPFGLARIAGSETVVRALRRAQENPSVAAIVLRVDSSGGDGLASDLMYRAVLEAKKRKPVVASMGDVAASGGYYVSMGADQIFALPTTITGSIGVFIIKPALGKLGDKLGIHHDTIKRGDLAGVLSIFDPWTPEEKVAAQKWVDAFYDDFITEVGRARRMSKEQVDKIARGRVWSGHDALARGLVDKTGSLLDAIQEARVRAGIPDSEEVNITVIGEPTGLFESLAGDSQVLAQLFSSPNKGEIPQGIRALAHEVGLEPALLLEHNVKAMMPFAITVR